MRLLAVVATIVIASPVFAQDRAVDEAALRTRVVAFETAFNARDGAALGALYAADADLIVVDGAHVVGRAAIEAAARRDWAASAARRISLTVTGIRFLSPDIAIVSTRARFNEGPSEDRGTWIAVRQAGNWMIGALRVLPVARP